MHWRLMIALSISVFSVLGSVASAQVATLSLDETTQTTSTGTVVTVDVDIANVSNLYGYQFDLTFNPSILQAVSSSEGSFLASGGSTFFINGSNDNVGGTVSATGDTLLSAVNGVNGSGELAVFTFDAIGNGTSALAIQNETLLDSNFNVISDVTTGGSVTLGPTSIAAPEIDPNSATSALTLLLCGVAVLRGRRSYRGSN
jgi:adhesin HecA-like repeat protein